MIREYDARPEHDYTDAERAAWANGYAHGYAVRERKAERDRALDLDWRHGFYAGLACGILGGLLAIASWIVPMVRQ